MLQLLDRSVWGAFRKMVLALKDTWQRNNLGKSVTTYNLTSIVKDYWNWAVVYTNNTVSKSLELFVTNSKTFIDTDFNSSTLIKSVQPI